MGRRSRKRSGGAAPRADEPREPAPRRPPARPPSRHARIDEAPPAPWHPIPLVELTILAGIILIVLAVVIGGDSRPVLLFGGLALVTVASLELAIREHLAGYRSHSSLLAGLVAVLVAVPLFFTKI